MIRRVTLALRVLLGAVFIYAAYTKLRQSWLLFALSIDSLQLLPEWAVFTLARTLPALELALGVLLIAGVWLRYLSVVAAAILAVVGVVYLPAHKRLYYGSKNNGSFVVEDGGAPERLKASDNKDFALMNLAVSRNHRSPKISRIGRTVSG